MILHRRCVPFPRLESELVVLAALVEVMKVDEMGDHQSVTQQEVEQELVVRR